MFEILLVNTLLVFLFFHKLAMTTRAAARGYHFSIGHQLLQPIQHVQLYTASRAMQCDAT